MDGVWVLARTARRLNKSAGAPALPALWAFTDPARTPDPMALALRLPRGAGLVYRHFGAADRFKTAARLALACRARGLTLLIGGDPVLARSVKADGVHWPEARAPRRKTGFRIETAAAHSTAALRSAGRAGLDGVFLSPVFASASASAGRPIGALIACRMARAAELPVFALGGVNADTAPLLRGFAGLAGVEAFSA